MTTKEAVNVIYSGNTVNCSKNEYPAIRQALQDFAGKSIDSGDGLRGMMALEEVRRLDKELGFQIRIDENP